MRHLCWILVIAALTCQAGQKKRPPITNEAGNDNLDIKANPLILPDEIKTALGDSLPTGIVAVEVSFVPKGENPISVSVNDFVLLSHKDGQRSAAYMPSQIAGSAVMVVKNQTVGGQALGRNRGPVMIGAGPLTSGVGNEAANETKTSVELKDDPSNPKQALLKLLAQKMLPEKETTEPLKGLLYFPLDGKVKTKDLELIYQGPAGRLYVNFR